MSASIDTNIFRNYFTVRVNGYPVPSPVVSIPGRTYSVQLFYLDDLQKLGRVRPNAFSCIRKLVCDNSLFSVIKSFKVEQLLLDDQASQRSLLTLHTMQRFARH